MGHTYDRQCRCDRCQNTEIGITQDSQRGLCAGRDFTSDTFKERQTPILRPVTPTYLP